MTSLQRIHELVKQLNQYRDEYYNHNSPSVSDAVYDRLFDELSSLEKDTSLYLSDSPTQTVGYPVVSSLPKVIHPVPLLSLDKTKQLSDIISFQKNRPILLMLKLDGLTVKLTYENGTLVEAATRGDGEEGEIITHNAAAFYGLPIHISYQQKLVVSGEAFIHKSDFQQLKERLVDSSGKPYKNSRNLAAGSVRCFDANDCKERRVHFISFNVLEGLDDITSDADSKYAKLTTLKALGFGSCHCSYLPQSISSEDLVAKIEELKEYADAQSIPIDGIVATYDSISYSKSCGRTGHHYNDGIAFKFEDDLFETVLRSIEWTPTRFGELAPVAIFDTVEIDGCDVSRATLHNLTFIKELELVPGNRILVSKRNMIIPHLEENLDRGSYVDSYPTVCPCCGETTRVQTSQRDNVYITETLHCDNPACETQWLRKMVHFVSKKAMDIDGLSEATLDTFIKQGWLDNYTDLYQLDMHQAEIILLPGFGQKSYEKLWKSIQKSRNTTFVRYLVSMDIPMIGRTASRALDRCFASDLNQFETAAIGNFDFTQLQDFGHVLNQNIHAWFSDEENIKLWKELQQTMTFEKINEEKAISEVSDNPFMGRTVVVTGTLEHFTRSSINLKLEALGAKAGNSVSKNTDYLIAGEKAGSKLTKASDLGVTVLTEQQFLEMVGE